MTATALTPEQLHASRLAALAKGNHVRTVRAQAKHRLAALHPKDSPQVLGQLLIRNPEWLSSLQVFALLTWLPRYGPARIRLSCERAKVGQLRYVGDLTPGERWRLATVLGWDGKPTAGNEGGQES